MAIDRLADAPTPDGLCLHPPCGQGRPSPTPIEGGGQKTRARREGLGPHPAHNLNRSNHCIYARHETMDAATSTVLAAGGAVDVAADGGVTSAEDVAVGSAAAGEEVKR